MTQPEFSPPWFRIQRFLQLPGPILEARRVHEAQRLLGVLADERQGSKLRLHPSRADVLVDDRGEHALGVRAADRALQVGVLDQGDVGRVGAEDDAVLRDAVQLDARDRIRLGCIVLTAP